MLAAGRIAVNRGLLNTGDFDRQNALLARIGISGSVRDCSADDMYEAMTRDKKVSGGRIRFVLQDAIGSVRINDDITRDEIIRGTEYMKAYIHGD